MLFFFIENDFFLSTVFKSGPRDGNKDSGRGGYTSGRIHAITGSCGAVISIR